MKLFLHSDIRCPDKEIIYKKYIKIRKLKIYQYELFKEKGKVIIVAKLKLFNELDNKYHRELVNVKIVEFNWENKIVEGIVV